VVLKSILNEANEMEVRLDNINYKEEIIEFLIVHQPYIKAHLEELKTIKDQRLESTARFFHEDVIEQYDARIKQWIALYCAKSLALPMEYIVIELEKIELEDYLNV
jgi:hypothetical protein